MKKSYKTFLTVLAFTIAPLCSAFALNNDREEISQNGHRFNVHRANTDYPTLTKTYTGTFVAQGPCADLIKQWNLYVSSCAETGEVLYHDFMNKQKVRAILNPHPELYTRIFSYLKPKIEYMSVGSEDEDEAQTIPLILQENIITETTQDGEKQKISDRQTAYVLPLSMLNIEKNATKLSPTAIAALQVLQDERVNVHCVFKEHVRINLVTGQSTHARELVKTSVSATAPEIILEEYRDAFMLGDNKIAFTAKSKHGTHVLGIYAAVGHRIPDGWGTRNNFLLTDFN